MKNNAVFMSSTEARENCGRRCVEQMGIPERVFVQCLSQGTSSGVVAFAVAVIVVVVVVVVVVSVNTCIGRMGRMGDISRGCFAAGDISRGCLA